MKKISVLVFIAVLICCGKADASLRVATASTYPPYEFLDVEGKLDGFDYEMMEEIGRRLNEKIEWNDTRHYDMVIPALVTGRVDIIAAGMSATPVRARRVLFSTPYVPTMAVFVTSPGKNVQSVSDLRGLRGCVPVGTTQDVYLTPLSAKYGFSIKNFSKIEECVWDIVTGRSDFTLMDVPVAEKLLAKKVFSGKVTKGGSFRLTGAGKALAVRLNDIKLKKRLDSVISEMEKDGTLNTLRNKWGL